MDNNLIINEEVLWDYADGFLTPEEHREVDTYLQLHPDWQIRLEEVMAFRAQLHATPLEKPRSGFTDRVMAAWATEQVQAYQPGKNKDWIVFSVAAAFGLFILGGFVAVLVSLSGMSNTPSQMELPQVQLPMSQLGAILQNQTLQMAFPIVLAVLSLFVLDKYLRHRRFLQNLANGQ